MITLWYEWQSTSGKDVNKFKTVANYNPNMEGVDFSDNMMVHSSTARNRLKKSILSYVGYDISKLLYYIQSTWRKSQKM